MTQPDFLMIPTQLLTDKSLQPLDRILFGYIYWMTKLKNERCTASNLTFAELMDTTAATIKNSMVRLEQAGYIEKLYKDPSRRVRIEVRCLLSFGKRHVASTRSTRRKVASNDATVASNDATSLQGYVASGDAQNKKEEEKLKRRDFRGVDNSGRRAVASGVKTVSQLMAEGRW